MAQPRHLRNAPIREALIDITVKLPDESDLHVLEALRDSISSEYPISNEITAAEFSFELKEMRPPEFATKALGYACRNTDKSRVVQFRLNGFTYNWLKPYSTWEDLRDVAQTYWKLYSDSLKPVSVTRLGLRYINNVVLPLPFDDFGEYLETQPTIPAGLPQTLSHFLTRVGLTDDDAGLGAIVTQVFEGVVRPTEITIIVDIDTSKQVALKPDDDSAEIWQTLDALRNFKNRIFFESLTEKALRLFE